MSGRLTPEQYHVLREKGTEPAFSGEYDSLFDPGMYRCGACGTQLFESDKKFDAVAGQVFYGLEIQELSFSTQMIVWVWRTEVTCATCGSHLGHVFEGEGLGTPTDQRYCINSLSLKFDPKKRINGHRIRPCYTAETARYCSC